MLAKITNSSESIKDQKFQKRNIKRVIWDTWNGFRYTYEDTISNTRQWCLMDSDAEHPIAFRRPGILRLSESVIKRVIG